MFNIPSPAALEKSKKPQLRHQTKPWGHMERNNEQIYVIPTFSSNFSFQRCRALTSTLCWMVLTLTILSSRSRHMCPGMEDEHRWSRIAVGSRRSVKGDLSPRAQQALGRSYCHGHLLKILTSVSALFLLLKTSSLQEQQ